MTQSKDYYGLLGVSPTASTEEIRRAYRRQIAKVHPDKPGGDETLARELEEARTALLDPVARARYDAQRAGGDLLDEAVDALSEVGSRAIDRLTVTLQARGHDILGLLRAKAAGAIRNRKNKR